MFKEKFKNGWVWANCLLGGSLYACLEWYFDRYAIEGPSAMNQIHRLLDLGIPILFGIMVALGIQQYQQQKILNQRLSIENTGLRGKLLTHTLVSYILHEIRNPVHNLAALLDRGNNGFPKEEFEMIQRNLERLSTIANTLKHIDAVSDHINVTESVFFPDWIPDFIKNTLTPSMRFRYEQKIEPVTFKIHPLLLEQCLSLLFENAFLAAAQSQPQGSVLLTAQAHSDREGCGLIRICNTGVSFPPDVLAAQGRYMVKSTQGSGLGLVLVRDTLKQVNGEMLLVNQSDMAEVKLYIPVETAS